LIIAFPPVFAGALNETMMDRFWGSSETNVGASGSVKGVAVSADEAPSEVPRAFCEVIITLYDCPFVRSENVNGELVLPIETNVLPESTEYE
jgi:hypothetical protein